MFFFQYSLQPIFLIIQGYADIKSMDILSPIMSAKNLNLKQVINERVLKIKTAVKTKPN